MLSSVDVSSLGHVGPTTTDLVSRQITPSGDTTYTLSEIVSALTFNNHQPLVGHDYLFNELVADKQVECDNMTLSSVLWPFQVQGPLQSGSLVPSSLLKWTSSCPAEGIM